MTVLELTKSNWFVPPILNNKLNLPMEKIVSLMERMEYVEPPGCWLWTGGLRKGYGVVQIRAIQPKVNDVHRLCFRLAYGDTENGKHLHHIVEAPVNCIGPKCGNPNHLRVTDPIEHTMDLTPNSLCATFARRDRCSNGHIYTEENTRMTESGRRCRICDKTNDRKSYWENRGDPDRPKGKWSQKYLLTHCKRGHEMTPENSYYQNGYRSCLACRNEYRKRKQNGIA